jgi:hypothetical protein
MKEEHLLMYALVFVLGFVVARMMRGRLVEGDEGNADNSDCPKLPLPLDSKFGNQMKCEEFENEMNRCGFTKDDLPNNPNNHGGPLDQYNYCQIRSKVRNFPEPLQFPQLIKLHKEVLKSNEGHKEKCNYKECPLGEKIVYLEGKYNYCPFRYTWRDGGWNQPASPALLNAMKKELGENVKLTDDMHLQFCHYDNSLEDQICIRNCNYKDKCYIPP